MTQLFFSAKTIPDWYIIYSSSTKIDQMIIKFPASTKQWPYLLYVMYKFVPSDAEIVIQLWTAASLFLSNRSNK